jgi:hypothetical protein
MEERVIIEAYLVALLKKRSKEVGNVETSKLEE